jgi:glycosyltransferase involved in cell wall biosynthesis
MQSEGQTRALVVSSMYSEAETAQRIGREAYSYRFVYRAFAPLLERWGRTSEITRPESRLDYALWRARQQSLEPVHLSFLPLHLVYLTQRAPNIAFPFWEFPDVPDTSFANNPRNNWVWIANHLALVLTASTFTRDAFVRAGVKTPVHVVPVPIDPRYFDVAAWKPDQRAELNCPCYLFPQPEAAPPPDVNPWVREAPAGLNPRAWLRQGYRSYIKPRLPARLDRYLGVAAGVVRGVRAARQEDVRPCVPAKAALELSGVVYTSILNPYDPRKNWQDLLSAYLLALRDCEDATLVVKLVVCPELAAPAFNSMIEHYRRINVRHRCKLAFVTEYLSEAQMAELAQASTYYVNSARAEGSCLPLQDFLAAGRPGIAPCHTAMTDYFSDALGFPIASHPEPAGWPHAAGLGYTTTWHRLVWQSLHDQFRRSYEVAKRDQPYYRALAVHGRERMAEFAGAERVWPRLAAALDSIPLATGAPVGSPQSSWSAPIRKAS